MFHISNNTISGQLGVGDIENRVLLTEITALRDVGIVKVTGGFHHSLVLAHDGTMYAFGRGDSGQVCIM